MIKKVAEKKRTLLIDGSVIVYRIASAIEEATEWEDDVWTLHSDAKLGKEILDNQINHYKKKLNCGDIEIAMDDKVNFRKEIYPDYKSNRKKNIKPIIVKPLKE